MNLTKILLLSLFTAALQSNAQVDRIEAVESGLILPKTYSQDKYIKKSLSQQLAGHKITGASVAVIDNGKIDWAKSYGYQDAETKKPITPETLFQCASIGKIITSVAILKLVKDGKIALDDPVNDLLKSWKLNHGDFAANQVTIRHLLSHSAGLRDGYGFPGYTAEDDIPSVIEILDGSPPSNVKKEIAVRSEPGTVEKYSGAGFLILQLLTEEVTGEKFEDYVSRSVFEPLGMVNTIYDYQPDINLEREIASGHMANGKGLSSGRYNLYPEKAPAGPWTTAEDLAKLVIEIQKEYHDQSDLILNQQLVKELLTPQINNKGLAVNLKGVREPQAFWHAGNNLGYTALLYGLIDKGQGAIVLTNSDGGEAFIQEFVTSVSNAYDWPVMRSYQTLENPDNLDKLEGKYINSSLEQVLFIGYDNKGLFLRRSNSKRKVRLYRIAENSYTVRDGQDYVQISFEEKGDNNYQMVFAQGPDVLIDLKKVE